MKASVLGILGHAALEHEVDAGRELGARSTAPGRRGLDLLARLGREVLAGERARPVSSSKATTSASGRWPGC